MSDLATLNPSMGLMVEQVVPLSVHRMAPSKQPAARLQQLRYAGELGLPFTTGLLLGIGETAADRTAALRSIAEIAEQHGHIQEVILQPFSAGDQDTWQKDSQGIAMEKNFDLSMLPSVVAEAKEVLPEDVVIQVPPNLLTSGDEDEGPDLLLQCLNAGARDIGGLSPKDEVNPSYDFPEVPRLQEILEKKGFDLVPRLCVHESKFSLLDRPETRHLHERLLNSTTC
eukprot:TRINITY_DN54146_c0_g1_i1.p1 TRINITY_DN54146_c0_g1~~TRINITY_DN54146_c0_g1_i1.p1  ORF type:complete len:264 (+),score=60.47 TRINITY_DN54146_c0_g1_i1:114-794(+)